MVAASHCDRHPSFGGSCFLGRLSGRAKHKKVQVPTMKWVSTIQTSDSFETALRGAKEDLNKAFGRSKADFGLLFVSSSLREEIVDLWPSLCHELPIKTLIGCTGGGVIGGNHEIEDKPALSVQAALLPKVDIHSFDIQQNQLPSSDGSPQPWRDVFFPLKNKDPQFLLLTDPFSIDADSLISGLDFAFPNAIKVGGLSSGGAGPKKNLLIHNEKILTSGAVGVGLSGEIKVESVVAQGCRPIGKPLTVTQCQDNVLIEADDEPPVHYLSKLHATLNEKDQDLLTHSLFLGIVTDPFKDNPKRGNFLVRNIIGMDQEKGTLAIGVILRKGQKVQFHLRDAETSKEDLQLMLNKSSSAGLKHHSKEAFSSSGAVLFSCLGRGRHLYGKPDHDISLLKSIVGDIPVGGFFCNGEIGPVDGRTFLHGYTSSIAIFTEPSAVPPPNP